MTFKKVLPRVVRRTTMPILTIRTGGFSLNAVIVSICNLEPEDKIAIFIDHDGMKLGLKFHKADNHTAGEFSSFTLGRHPNTIKKGEDEPHRSLRCGTGALLAGIGITKDMFGCYELKRTKPYPYHDEGTKQTEHDEVDWYADLKEPLSLFSPGGQI